MPIDAHRFIEPASPRAAPAKYLQYKSAQAKPAPCKAQQGNAVKGNALRGTPVPDKAAIRPSHLPLNRLSNGDAPRLAPRAPARHARNIPAPQVAQRVVAQNVRNVQAPQVARRVAAPQSLVNIRINQLFESVRQQEKGLRVSPPEATSCTDLPKPTGLARDVQHSSGNLVDCLVSLAHKPGAGNVSIINPADSRNCGGGLGVKTFAHDRMPAEETLCVLGLRAKAGLDVANVAGAYPLGPEKDGQRQLYSTGLQFRHSWAELSTLLKVRGTPRERLAAQQQILLDASFRKPSATPDTSPRYDMISIAAIDRRNHPGFNADTLYNGMLRQFAHAMVAARQRGVNTFILSLPGSGLFSKTSRDRNATPDPDYQHALACAAVDAIRYFSRGLDRVVLPSHGAELDALIDQYARERDLIPAALSARYNRRAATPAPARASPEPRPVQRAQPTPLNPSVQPNAVKSAKPQLIARSMGDLDYKVERDKVDLRSASRVVDVLGALLGDGEHASLRRVHGLEARTDSPQAYIFHRRDTNPKIGRALVSVKVSPTQREIYQVTFSRHELPALAGKVAAAPWTPTPPLNAPTRSTPAAASRGRAAGTSAAVPPPWVGR